MEVQTKRTKRTYITGNTKRRRKLIDMEAVYKDFDDGKTWAEVCEKHGASRTTILRRHKEYQAAIDAAEQIDLLDSYSFPPLPE